VYTLAVISSFTIAIGAIIGLVRFSKINQAYYPFVILLWIGLINESISYLLGRLGFDSQLNNNVYVLVESILITWQFKNWKVFKKSNWLFWIIVCSLLVYWVIEMFFIFGITKLEYNFRILYSFLVVLMSVNKMNDLIVRERRNILKNPIFLICIALILYFSLKVLVELFDLYGISVSYQFQVNVAYTQLYINLIANLIYALAVLWMPTKHRFSMSS
jgi:hypothetical protein